jgi:hypothetical protein
MTPHHLVYDPPADQCRAMVYFAGPWGVHCQLLSGHKGAHVAPTPIHDPNSTLVVTTLYWEGPQ